MDTAATLEELRDVLTVDTWRPYAPADVGGECLVTAMKWPETGTLEDSPIYRQIVKVIGPGFSGALGDWNDQQTSVEAVHAMIDKAIKLRDAAA